MACAALQSVALTRVLAAAWPAPETGGLHTPARVAARLNAEFPVNNEVWQYFTFLGGVLDLSSLTLRYVSAGHPGPIHVPAGADPIALAAAGLPNRHVPRYRVHRVRGAARTRGSPLLLLGRRHRGHEPG